VDGAPTAYRFQFRRHCFCGPDVVRLLRIQVLDDEVVAVHDVETGEPVTQPIASFPTIDDLFAEIEDAIQRKAFRIQATYDDERGYPIDVSIDYIEYAVDEEMAFQVREFEVLPQLSFASRETSAIQFMEEALSSSLPARMSRHMR